MSAYAAYSLAYSAAGAVASFPISSCTTGFAVQSSVVANSEKKSSNSKDLKLRTSTFKSPTSTGYKLLKSPGVTNLTHKDSLRKAAKDAKAALKAAGRKVKQALRPSKDSPRSTSPLVAEALLAMTESESWDAESNDSDDSWCSATESRDFLAFCE